VLKDRDNLKRIFIKEFGRVIQINIGILEKSKEKI
jgi:hypothetical protein